MNSPGTLDELVVYGVIGIAVLIIVAAESWLKYRRAADEFEIKMSIDKDSPCPACGCVFFVDDAHSDHTRRHCQRCGLVRYGARES